MNNNNNNNNKNDNDNDHEQVERGDESNDIDQQTVLENDQTIGEEYTDEGQDEGEGETFEEDTYYDDDNPNREYTDEEYGDIDDEIMEHLNVLDEMDDDEIEELYNELIENVTDPNDIVYNHPILGGLFDDPVLAQEFQRKLEERYNIQHSPQDTSNDEHENDNVVVDNNVTQVVAQPENDDDTQQQNNDSVTYYYNDQDDNDTMEWEYYGEEEEGSPRLLVLSPTELLFPSRTPVRVDRPRRSSRFRRPSYFPSPTLSPSPSPSSSPLPSSPSSEPSTTPETISPTPGSPVSPPSPPGPIPLYVPEDLAAADRLQATYLRTGLSIMVAGVGLSARLGYTFQALFLSIFYFAAGVIILIIGSIRNYYVVAYIKRGYMLPAKYSVVAVVTCALILCAISIWKAIVVTSTGVVLPPV